MSSSPLTPYQRDLYDQARALRDTLTGLREQPLPSSLLARLTGGDFRRIVLTGMGSSLHALHPLYQALIARGPETGRETYMAETSELLHFQSALLREDSLIVAVSQSGYSAETVSLLDRCAAQAPSQRFAVLGISNTAGSPLHQRSDACLLTRAGEEATVSTKTYLSTLAALKWIEPVLTNQPAGQALSAIEQAPAWIDAYLRDLPSHVVTLKQRLQGITNLFLVGRGPSLATAYCGGLIIKESTRLHSEGMSVPGYRHGPLELSYPGVFVLVFAGQGPTAALNRRLYEDLQPTGAGTALVAHDAQEAVFRVPDVPAPLLPLYEILPVQMMTLALAELHGREAGHFTRNTKVTTVE